MINQMAMIRWVKDNDLTTTNLMATVILLLKVLFQARLIEIDYFVDAAENNKNKEMDRRRRNIKEQISLLLRRSGCELMDHGSNHQKLHSCRQCRTFRRFRPWEARGRA